MSHSTKSPIPYVPLNAFQRLARDWDIVHPYNAAQFIELQDIPDFRTADSAWAESLGTLGLGRVTLAGPKQPQFRYETLNGEMAFFGVKQLSVGVDLSSHLSTELNRRFDDPTEPPFRPFLLPGAPGSNTCWLGVVYQHWVADSAAIRLLLREWFVRIYDPAKARTEPLRFPNRGYWKLFGPRYASWRTDETVLGLIRRHHRYRRSRKARTFGEHDYPTRVLLRTAADGTIDRLICAARTAGVKVNDIFLAALAETCNQFVPTQYRQSRRGLALASVVDLRPHAGRDLSDTFGLFLGVAEVTCQDAHLRNFDRLLASISSQNALYRRRGMPQSSLAWLIAAIAARRFVPRHKIYHFYRKETPLIGGISNVNLNGTWACEYHPAPIRQYLRVSPTGPMAPVAVAVTTLGSQMHLSMTYRPALLCENAADQLVSAFLDRIAQVAAT